MDNKKDHEYSIMVLIFYNVFYQPCFLSDRSQAGHRHHQTPQRQKIANGGTEYEKAFDFKILKRLSKSVQWYNPVIFMRCLKCNY